MFEVLNQILVREGYYQENWDDEDDWDDPDRVAPTQKTFYYDREFIDESVHHEGASFSLDLEEKNVLSFSVSAGRYIRYHKTFKFEESGMTHEEFNKAAEATLRYFFSNWNKCYQDWNNFNLIAA